MSNFGNFRNADLHSFFFFFTQEIQLDELLTHEVLVEDIDKAFENLKKPDCVKVLSSFN